MNNESLFFLIEEEIAKGLQVLKSCP